MSSKKAKSKLIDEENQADSKEENKKQQEDAPKKTSFTSLFRYSTGMDKFCMILGSLAAIGAGYFLSSQNFKRCWSSIIFDFFWQCHSIFVSNEQFQQVADTFGPASTTEDIYDSLKDIATKMIILAGGVAVLAYTMFSCWMLAGDRQGIRLRKKYFEALLKQDIKWYDKINPSELATKVANETNDVQNAIGEKVATFLQQIGLLVSGLVIGFTKGWLLSFVILAFFPLIAIATVIYLKSTQGRQKKTDSGYNKAGAQAEQCISEIKTVKSLIGEDYEISIYQKLLIEVKNIALKYAVFSSLAVGILTFVMTANYGFGFFIGSFFVQHDIYNPVHHSGYTVGDVLAVFFSIIFASFALGTTQPCVKAFVQGQQSGYKIFEIIDAVPTIKLDEPDKIAVTNLKGNIEFQSVNFAYPNNPSAPVLNNMNLKIQAFSKVALVGESGCGKTTIMQLIERFYDVDSGSLIIDGNNIKDLNLRQLRKLIGYVGQEPVLFAASIRENLLYGNETASEDQMIEALKVSLIFTFNDCQQANAWSFVSKLEKGIDTFVGVGGRQFSGGQKQRISIARSILKNPPLLLLDVIIFYKLILQEATSALDRKNEVKIQTALDQICVNRTTIVIAHRLTTVQNADKILFIEGGKVCEEGTHQELMSMNGKYANLVRTQLSEEAVQQIAEDEDENNFNEEENHKEIDLRPNEQIDIEYNNNENSTGKPTNSNLQTPLLQKSNSLRKSSVRTSQIAKPAQTEPPALTPEQMKAQKQAIQKQVKQMYKRLWGYNKGQYIYSFLGLILAVVAGGSFPFLAIALSKIMNVMALPPDINPDFRKDANLYSLYFLILAIVQFIGQTGYIYFLDVTAQYQTLKLRKDLYQKIIYMPIKWFDEPTNSPGALTARLAVDSNSVNGLTSHCLGIIISALSAFISGPIIAFLASWRLSLITLAATPFLILSAKLQAGFSQGYSVATDQSYKESGSVIQETVCNIRTVYSFANEKILIKIFDDKLKKPIKDSEKKAYLAGIAFAFSNFIIFAIYSADFFFGGLFVYHYSLSMDDMFTSMFAIMFAAFQVGNVANFMPDVGKGIAAGMAIFALIDTKDEIQLQEEIDETTSNKASIKKIEFQNVKFKYPTREKVVFEKLNLTMEAGKKIALVGESGCGKSTIFQLLLKFYDIQEGKILIDGIDIHKYHPQKLRYNTKDVQFEDIKQAASQANALNFIENNQFESANNEADDSVGQGFDRQVGPKGTQISGGQKQRIAIARAILKKPKILLLDEATRQQQFIVTFVNSALDSKNEKIVQESLDNIMKDKTSITIAHRISTIKDSDVIYVFDEGNIIEQGTYSELIAKRGYFYNFEKGKD